MSTPGIIDPTLIREEAEPPIVRLAIHAIGLWRAAKDIGDPQLIAALRPMVEHIGRALALDVMASAVDDDTKH